MTLYQQVAQTVASKMNKETSDRYDQIWAIKQELLALKLDVLATDRETIDDTLDVLFTEYGFKG